MGASSEDTRACAGKYCKSGVDFCPTDAFVTCVKEKTQVSALLQWDDLLSRFDHSVVAMDQHTQSADELSFAHDVARRVFLQAKVNALVPSCEAMCKRLGAYPDCQCPGFNGEPASSEDTRACAGEYCKSGVDQCPTDAFVTCVKEKTQVSALLQWDELMSKFDYANAKILELAGK